MGSEADIHSLASLGSATVVSAVGSGVSSAAVSSGVGSAMGSAVGSAMGTVLDHWRSARDGTVLHVVVRAGTVRFKYLLRVVAVNK